MPVEVPKGWSTLSLGEVIAEHHDRVGDQQHLQPLSLTKHGGLVLALERFGRALHSKDVARYRHVRRDEIVVDPMLLWDGAVARLTRFDEGFVSPDYRVFRANPTNVDLQFLDHWLHGPEARTAFENGARGTNIRRNRIGRDDFVRVAVTAPPLPEQQKIAAIVSSVDEAIQATQAVIDQTRRVKEGLLQDLLIRGIGHTRFKQTEIGEIPESWRVRALGTMLTDVSYGTSEPAMGTQADLPVLRIPNVSDGRVDLTDLKYIALEDKQVDRFSVRPGDILVIRTNGNPDIVGRCALAQDGLPRCLYASYLIKLVPDPSQLLPAFASTFINSAYARRYLDRERATSAGNYNINSTQLKGLPVPMPPLAEQGAIVERFASIQNVVDGNGATLTRLFAAKVGLLDDLLTGRVRVTP